MTAHDLSTSEAVAQARAEAMALLQGVTSEKWERFENSICADYKFKDGKHCAEWIAELADPSDFDDTLNDGWQTYSPTNDANAALITAAPTTTLSLIGALDALAATRQALAEAEAERDALREASHVVIRQGINTEYVNGYGQPMENCPLGEAIRDLWKAVTHPYVSAAAPILQEEHP